MKRVRPGYSRPVTRRAKLAILFLAAGMALATGAVASSPAAGGAFASRAACPGQGNANAPSAAQEKTMLCLVNHPRPALRP
jgi:hypothetical protein